MNATLMPMPMTAMRSAAPCAPAAGQAYAAPELRATLVPTSPWTDRWLGVRGSIVGHTDSFGTKRNDPDRLDRGLT